MATETYKVLGQVRDGVVNALQSLYTVPGATSAVVSSLSVTNRLATPQTFRLSVAVAGAADDNKQYVYYDTPINPNDTIIATLGVTLGAADVIRCQSNVASGLTFQAFGVEIA